MSFRVTSDTITPGITQVMSSIYGAGRRAILEAMGESLVGSIKRAFSDPALRPTPWAPMADSTRFALAMKALSKRKNKPGQSTQVKTPLLRRSGSLWQSIRISALSNTSVEVGTDRLYAAWQQFGTKPYTILPSSKKALWWPGASHPVKRVNHPGIPARPFFPFSESGEMTEAARARVTSAARAKLASLLRLSR
jgi:phage gpG-like protein